MALPIAFQLKPLGQPLFYRIARAYRAFGYCLFLQHPCDSRGTTLNYLDKENGAPSHRPLPPPPPPPTCSCSRGNVRPPTLADVLLLLHHLSSCCLTRAAEVTRKKALDELESGLKFQATLDIEQVGVVPSWLAQRRQGGISLWFWQGWGYSPFLRLVGRFNEAPLSTTLRANKQTGWIEQQ